MPYAAILTIRLLPSVEEACDWLLSEPEASGTEPEVALIYAGDRLLLVAHFDRDWAPPVLRVAADEA